MNKKVTLFICLVGLAALASLAVQAQDAPANTPGSKLAPQTQPDVADGEDEEFLPGDEEDEEDYLEYDDEYDDEEEYEDEEEEESDEQKLSELAEDHYAVKNDCQDLQNMIAQAKQSNGTVDPDLVESYDGCKQVLKDIETDMKALYQAIFAETLSLA